MEANIVSLWKKVCITAPIGSPCFYFLSIPTSIQRIRTWGGSPSVFHLTASVALLVSLPRCIAGGLIAGSSLYSIDEQNTQDLADEPVAIEIKISALCNILGVLSTHLIAKTVLWSKALLNHGFLLNHFLIYMVLCGARNKSWKTPPQCISAEL